jgi:hypothetical protein
LYKYFAATNENKILETDVDMLADPFESIEKLSKINNFNDTSAKIEARIVLPLYTKKAGEPTVMAKSGLNLWNASNLNRKRKFGESEIRILSEIKDYARKILPPRKTKFYVTLPNGKLMSLVVSQQGDKALTSSPGKALGVWFFYIVGLKQNEILTYKRLLELGVDSIELRKMNGQWHMDILKTGSYENFLKSIQD